LKYNENISEIVRKVIEDMENSSSVKFSSYSGSMGVFNNVDEAVCSANYS
jgi:hypothetical protein